MSSLQTNIGPFAALYVGLTGQASALTQINSTRTSGATVIEALPTEYVVAVDNSVQSGNHTVTIALSFLGAADETIRLARGLNLTEDINNGPAQNQYALFLADFDSTGNGSVYLPKVRTLKEVNTPKTKTSPTITQITFIAEAREILPKIIYRGTYATLQAQMGSQYPL